MRPHRRTDVRSPQHLRPWVEWLEERCVFSVGLLDLDAGLVLSVRSVVSFGTFVVDNAFAFPSAGPITGVVITPEFETPVVVTPDVPAPPPLPEPVPVPDAPKPSASIDWGDGVVTGATVATDAAGQTVVTADRTLAPATTYDARLTLSDGGPATGDTVIAFQLTTAVPAPNLTPPPEPAPSVPNVPDIPSAPPPRLVAEEPVPEVTDTPEGADVPFTPPPKPAPEPQPVVVRITVGPPVGPSQPQFEAGAVHASLSAPAEPAVSVTATSAGGPVQVSAVQVVRTALSGTAPQPQTTDSVFVSAPRSLEVAAATRVTARTAFGRQEPRPLKITFDLDWHGVALANGAAETDEVLTALAAEPVADAPFFVTSLQPEAAPLEGDSVWQSAYVVIAAIVGLGARHYFVRDDETDSLDECTT